VIDSGGESLMCVTNIKEAYTRAAPPSPIARSHGPRPPEVFGDCPPSSGR
jgi:hypothetical protein